MTKASIAADINQTLDVHGHFAAQSAFDLVVCFKHLPELGYVSIRKVFDAHIGIHTCCRQDFLRRRKTDTEDIPQCGFNAFRSW